MTLYYAVMAAMHHNHSFESLSKIDVANGVLFSTDLEISAIGQCEHDNTRQRTELKIIR